jgi:hypothetical protein
MFDINETIFITTNEYIHVILYRYIDIVICLKLDLIHLYYPIHWILDLLNPYQKYYFVLHIVTILKLIHWNVCKASAMWSTTIAWQSQNIHMTWTFWDFHAIVVQYSSYTYNDGKDGYILILVIASIKCDCRMTTEGDCSIVCLEIQSRIQ